MSAPDSYEAACERHATAQGLDPLSVLETLGYDYGVVQTGGFCMVGQVDHPSKTPAYIWITFEGDGFLVCSYDVEDDAFDGCGETLADAASLADIPAIIDAWIASPNP